MKNYFIDIYGECYQNRMGGLLLLIMKLSVLTESFMKLELINLVAGLVNVLFLYNEV